MASYLITGSSRGIGLGYVTILARKDASEVSKIFAAARSENSSLKKLISESAGRIEFVPLEVTSEESAKKAAQHVERSLGDKGLDILINNAGILLFKEISEIRNEEFERIVVDKKKSEGADDAAAARAAS